jgi:hypothetical protein
MRYLPDQSRVADPVRAPGAATAISHQGRARGARDRRAEQAVLRVALPIVKRPPILHRALTALVRAFNRNPWTSHRLEPVPVDAEASYMEDGLWTNRGHAFVDDDRFCRAYERAVRAAGRDYGIRWRVHTILWAAGDRRQRRWGIR